MRLGGSQPARRQAISLILAGLKTTHGGPGALHVRQHDGAELERAATAAQTVQAKAVIN